MPAVPRSRPATVSPFHPFPAPPLPLQVSWVHGEQWFHVTLADCDAAINAMMWQHQGLCGVSQWLTSVECHPVRHARKCDPDGAQVRRFCPELAGLPVEHLHAPWAAPPGVLRAAGVELGRTYPHRIVQDYDAARQRFMEKLQDCRSAQRALMVGGLWRGPCTWVGPIAVQ